MGLRLENVFECLLFMAFVHVSFMLACYMVFVQCACDSRLAVGLAMSADKPYAIVTHFLVHVSPYHLFSNISSLMGCLVIASAVIGFSDARERERLTMLFSFGPFAVAAAAAVFYPLYCDLTVGASGVVYAMIGCIAYACLHSIRRLKSMGSAGGEKRFLMTLYAFVSIILYSYVLARATELPALLSPGYPVNVVGHLTCFLLAHLVAHTVLG